MIGRPLWRDNDKEKWMEQVNILHFLTSKCIILQKNFDLGTCLFNGKKSKQVWDTIETKITIGDPYINSLEAPGSSSCKRIKELEVNLSYLSMSFIIKIYSLPISHFY